MKSLFGILISLLIATVQSQPQPAGLALKCIALTGAPKSLGLQEQPTGTGASPGVCITACSASQIAYITGGANGKCFCSNDSNPSAEAVASTTCDSICMDGNYSGCGGPSEEGRSVFALYSVRFLRSHEIDNGCHQRRSFAKRQTR